MIGQPAWADEPSMATGAGRRVRGEEILRVAGEAFAMQPSEFWCAQMREAGILNERVNTYTDLFAHPQTEATQMFTWSEQSVAGRVPHPNIPGPQPLVSDAPLSKVPRIGEHTREVLTELGFAGADVERMFSQAVVFEPASSG